jgi:hypothetical protein
MLAQQLPDGRRKVMGDPVKAAEGTRPVRLSLSSQPPSEPPGKPPENPPNDRRETIGKTVLPLEARASKAERHGPELQGPQTQGGEHKPGFCPIYRTIPRKGGLGGQNTGPGPTGGGDIRLPHVVVLPAGWGACKRGAFGEDLSDTPGLATGRGDATPLPTRWPGTAENAT